MYRLLREHGSSGDRRAQASHPAKKKPELLATGPNDVWSWDITKLRGPARGIWYLLYVIMDIYSRKVVHWEVWPTETGDLAADFIRHAIAANNGIAPKSVHADRGTSMTSNTVSGLYAKLNIAQSHSRPHVSNDNPYSESAFKTLKYCPAFPGRFGSIQDANVFCEAFFAYYNNQHRHSGIAMHTPATVHDGSWVIVQARRAQTLRAAYDKRPDRFRGRCPRPRELPAKVWINEPPATIATSAPSPQTPQAALCLIQFDRLRPGCSLQTSCTQGRSTLAGTDAIVCLVTNCGLQLVHDISSAPVEVAEVSAISDATESAIRIPNDMINPEPTATTAPATPQPRRPLGRVTAGRPPIAEWARR